MNIYPVVHIQDTEQAVNQAEIALTAGADGIYLIDHKISDPFLIYDALNAVREAVGEDVFIGLNLLGPGPLAAYEEIELAHKFGSIDRYPDALWVDDAVGYNIKTSLKELKKVAELKKKDPELAKVKLLGGVAFKYTRAYTDNPDFAAAQARMFKGLIDEVTTSGSGTNSAPSPAKIAAMKEAIGDKPLAVASGISAENLAEYGDTIDDVLVASSVETAPYSGRFVKARLKKLIKAKQSIAA